MGPALSSARCLFEAVDKAGGGSPVPGAKQGCTQTQGDQKRQSGAARLPQSCLPHISVLMLAEVSGGLCAEGSQTRPRMRIESSSCQTCPGLIGILMPICSLIGFHRGTHKILFSEFDLELAALICFLLPTDGDAYSPGHVMGVLQGNREPSERQVWVLLALFLTLVLCSLAQEACCPFH